MEINQYALKIMKLEGKYIPDINDTSNYIKCSNFINNCDLCNVSQCQKCNDGYIFIDENFLECISKESINLDLYFSYDNITYYSCSNEKYKENEKCKRIISTTNIINPTTQNQEILTSNIIIPTTQNLGVQTTEIIKSSNIISTNIIIKPSTQSPEISSSNTINSSTQNQVIPSMNVINPLTQSHEIYTTNILNPSTKKDEISSTNIISPSTQSQAIPTTNIINPVTQSQAITTTNIINPSTINIKLSTNNIINPSTQSNVISSSNIISPSTQSQEISNTNIINYSTQNPENISTNLISPLSQSIIIQTTLPNIKTTIPSLETINTNIKVTISNSVTNIPNIETTNLNEESLIPNLETTVPNIITTVPNIKTTYPNIKTTTQNIETSNINIRTTIPNMSTSLEIMKTTIIKLETTIINEKTIIPNIVTLTTTDAEIVINETKNDNNTEMEKVATTIIKKNNNQIKGKIFFILQVQLINRKIYILLLVNFPISKSQNFIFSISLYSYSNKRNLQQNQVTKKEIAFSSVEDCDGTENKIITLISQGEYIDEEKVLVEDLNEDHKEEIQLVLLDDNSDILDSEKVKNSIDNGGMDYYEIAEKLKENNTDFKIYKYKIISSTSGCKFSLIAEQKIKVNSKNIELKFSELSFKENITSNCLISEKNDNNITCSLNEDIDNNYSLSPFIYSDKSEIFIIFQSNNTEYFPLKCEISEVKNNKIYNKSKRGLSLGAIVGIILAIIFVIGVIIAIIFLYKISNKWKNINVNAKKLGEINQIDSSIINSSSHVKELNF